VFTGSDKKFRSEYAYPANKAQHERIWRDATDEAYYEGASFINRYYAYYEGAR
jgi:hypothetical protein